MTHAEYITKGRQMTASEISKEIREDIDGMLLQDYFSKTEIRRMKAVTPSEIDEVSRVLEGLNNALLFDRSVFCVCDKEPRNLDSGSHYYSVYYVDEKGQDQIVWEGESLYWFIGQDRQDRDRSIRRYIYKSGAIGMSRVLDATDGLFTCLKSITGTYAQLH
jgi:hypothetical protein